MRFASEFTPLQNRPQRSQQIYWNGVLASKLLRNFVIDTSGRAVMAIGFLAGL